ncbi:DinB family protein [Paenibacillus sp. GYB003]|uniref:DinB family protein n=1 Tax=Paenibacillus sp. GYB003 TaxID=2994392 RepID=UPI002F96DF01
MSEIIIRTAQSLRQLVVRQVQAIPEEMFDIKPDVFNNNIRWNVGHIVFWMDSYLSLCFRTGSAIPASYAELFNSGTKPADWTKAPPSKEEMIRELSLQLEQISEISPDSLNKPLESPLQMGPLAFHLAGELFNFALIHEGLHLSACGSLLKVIQAGHRN